MIQNNWQELIKPTRLEIISEHEQVKRHARIVAEPLERGFGLTLGNALRRILLSSVRGAAITSVKIDGALHEFSSIPHVREDITEIVLNIKQVVLQVHEEGEKMLHLTKKGAGVVTAGDIETVADVEIMNPDLVLCTLDEEGDIRFEFTVNTGSGYVPAESNRSEDAPVGSIAVDSLYSPVRRVSYSVENTRSGQVLDYDKLIMDIETDGSVTPEDALALSSRILQDQLGTFVNFEDPKDVVEEKLSIVEEIGFSATLLKKVDELELSVRSSNCLKNDNIVYIGDLIQKSESKMLLTPNFGRKSLNEIKDILSEMGLHFGMSVPTWPPENIEELAKRFEDSY